MREEFSAIVSGWMLYDGLEDLTDRIEEAAEWTKTNGPLQPDEESTIKMMIESQIARGLASPSRFCECGNQMPHDDYYRDGNGNWICPKCLAAARADQLHDSHMSNNPTKKIILEVGDGPEGFQLYTSEEEAVVDFSSSIPALYLTASLQGARFKLGPFHLTRTLLAQLQAQARNLCGDL